MWRSHLRPVVHLSTCLSTASARSVVSRPRLFDDRHECRAHAEAAPVPKSGRGRGIAAISPQRVTGFCRVAGGDHVREDLQHGGAQQFAKRGDFRIVRSAAMRYCTRSLEPIDTKASSSSRAVEIETAAAGTSSIRPIGTRIAEFCVRRVAARPCGRGAIFRISSTVVTIGNINRTSFDTRPSAAMTPSTARISAEELRVLERYESAAAP